MPPGLASAGTRPAAVSAATKVVWSGEPTATSTTVFLLSGLTSAGAAGASEAGAATSGAIAGTVGSAGGGVEQPRRNDRNIAARGMSMVHLSWE